MFIDIYVPGAKIPFDFLSAFLERGGQALICGSHPVLATIPPLGLMGTEGYVRNAPFSFLRHFGYSEGEPDESAAAIKRYLFWSKFGIDTVTKPVDQSPRQNISGSGPDFMTPTTFWGMHAVGYTRGERGDFDLSPTIDELPDTLLFKPRVYEWFHDAGDFYNNTSGNWRPDPADPNAEHREFGLGEVEIYNWDWAALKLNTESRPSLYRSLLSYIPADSTTRWGTAPAPEHIQWDYTYSRYSETRYWLGQTTEHTVGLVSMVDPDAPSVLIGFTPFFLAEDTGYGLIDHIMLDIFNMSK
jgi:hypothetical protein